MKIVDPNNKVIVDPINNQETRYKDDFHSENGVNQMEQYFIYAEFIATRRSESVVVQGSSNGSSSNIESVDSQDQLTVNFLGYNQDGKENDGYYTTAYTDEITGNINNSLNRNKFEGFGITNIAVETNLNYITKVNISFIDAKMGASLNDAPYDILLSSIPQPLYRLRVKGFYGKVLTYELHLETIPNITFQPDTGYMQIDMKFVSNIWRPLADIKIKNLYTMAFMDSNPDRIDKLDIENKREPRNFYEFIEKGKKFYDDLIDVVNTDQLSEQEKTIRANQQTIKQLYDYSVGFGNKMKSLSQNRINVERDFNDNQKVYYLDVNEKINTNFQNFYTTNYRNFLTSLRNPEYVNTLGISTIGENNSFIISLEERRSDSFFYKVDFTGFNEKLQQENDANSQEYKRLSEEKTKIVNSVLQNNFGDFIPSARNILKLLCDDIDRYFKMLFDTSLAAEKYHKDNGISFNNGGEKIQAFPTYLVNQVVTSNNETSDRLTEKSPSNFDQNDEWEESKIVKDYVRAAIYRNFVDENLNERNFEFINNSGFSDEEIDNYAEQNNIEIAEDEVYRELKNVVDRWIKGVEKTSSQYAYPYNGGSPLIDKFKIVDRAFNDIGETCILDFKKLIKNVDISNTNCWIVISSLLMEENGFKVHPIQNFMTFSDQGWQDAFEPVEDITEENNATPSFVCQYVSNTSSEFGKGKDEFFISNEEQKPPDFNNNSPDLYVFKVGYGEQNQSYFKSVSVNTTQNTQTRESLLILDDIANQGGKRSPLVQGQSLYNIYERYSINCTVNALGTTSIQPTQYFELSNIPVFSGTYMVTDVSHTINAQNQMETVFNGVRIGRYVKPIVTDFVQTIDVFYDSVKLNLQEENNIASQNKTSRDVIQYVRLQEFDYKTPANGRTTQNITEFDEPDNYVKYINGVQVNVFGDDNIIQVSSF